MIEPAHRRRGCLKIKLTRLALFVAVIAGSVYAANAQTGQLPPHAAWDGLGPDPHAAPSNLKRIARHRDAEQKTKSQLNPTTKQLHPLVPSNALPNRDYLEDQAEKDEENLQLKRATEICRGC
jgi:hypothetical protein